MSDSPSLPVSEPRRIPEEIERAIEAYGAARYAQGYFYNGDEDSRPDTARLALDAAILSQLSAALARGERLEKALEWAASEFDNIANAADPYDDAVGTQDHGLLLKIEKRAGVAGEKVRAALGFPVPDEES